MGVGYRIVGIAAALLACASPAAAQRESTSPDTAAMRQALAAALGEDFAIVRTELSSGLSERAGVFWLVHVRPRRAGDYELRYRYDYTDAVRPDDPLYTHVEHTSAVRVGEAGCWRRGEGKDACLGDTVILPFVADHGGHVFTLAHRAAGAPRPPRVPGPVDGPLAVISVNAETVLRRGVGAPGAGAVIHHAVLQAGEPGRFNVIVDAEDGGPPPNAAAGSTPIVVVPRGEPVTVLIGQETVVASNARTGFSSHRGNQYLTTPLVLQPGDRISLPYARRGRPGEGETGLARPPVPRLTRLPFHVESGVAFNAWIAPHLASPSPNR